MEALEVLQQCTVEGYVIKLPNQQLDRAVYMEVKNKLGMIGGTWKGGKVQGFVFQEDPTQLLADLSDGGSRNLKKEFQFFGTPDSVADRVIHLANIPPTTADYMATVLEPEAGQGALIKALWRAGHQNLIWVCELMPLNASILKRLSDDISFIQPDVLTLPENWNNYFDRIIANPPFTKNQDIDHIRKMYEVCKPGGRISTCASVSWRTGSQKKQVAFRDWLDEIGAYVEDVDAGAFKESGTNVATTIIVIDKPAI